jgi:hypothetical protein
MLESVMVGAGRKGEALECYNYGSVETNAEDLKRDTRYMYVQRR